MPKMALMGLIHGDYWNVCDEIFCDAVIGYYGNVLYHGISSGGHSTRLQGCQVVSGFSPQGWIFGEVGIDKDSSPMILKDPTES